MQKTITKPKVAVSKKHATVIKLEQCLLQFTADPDLEAISVSKHGDSFIVRVDYALADKYDEFVID